MNTQIFIVTYHKDFQYLKYCLLSIEKFAVGFSGVTILVPDTDASELIQLVVENCKKVPVRCVYGNEWKGKGMLWHMAQIMKSDQWCPDADFIAHLDPDVVFTKPVTPETFIKNGKPFLQYERFSSIGHRHPGVLKWIENTQRCLPFDVFFETMRGFPHVFHNDLYRECRRLVEQKVKLPIDYYIESGRNEYPQEFCEFVTLGNVAMQCFPDKYILIDNALKPNPDKSDFPVFQAWSHAAPTEDVSLWIDGVSTTAVPMNIWKQLGLV